MTPREELLAAVETIRTVGIPEIMDDEMEGVISDWLELEAKQHWHGPQTEDPVQMTWDMLAKLFPDDWLELQPCIRMARLINEGGSYE